MRFIVLFSVASLGVFGPLDRIQKALDKADFEKVFELIEKGYEKDPENPGFDYYHAKLLFTITYDGFNADSARILMQIASDKLEYATDEIKTELLEDGVSHEMFERLTIEIRDYLFQETLLNLSLSSVIDYLRKYPNTVYDDILIYKRDSMVFKSVKRSDTQKDYLDFIRNYPTSVFKVEADSLLDRLRYLDLINNGNLKNYLDFRASYPLSYKMVEVEEYILKVATASHKPEAFLDFIRSCKTSKLKKKAADVLHYLSDEQVFNHPKRDSIKYALELSEQVVFPVMDHDIFGFHNTTGSMQVPHTFDDVQQQLKCAISKDDWLFVQLESEGNIILKDGTIMLTGVDAYERVSEALALVDRNGYRFLYHKSGHRVITDPVESAEVFENGWIKVERNNKWGLYTQLGLSIAEVQYDDVYRLGSFWVFERGDEIGVYTTTKILEEVEDTGLDLEFKFDDLELVNENLLIGFRGNRECLLDKDLNFLVPWGEHEIHPDPLGWYLRSEEGYSLYNTDERTIDSHYSYLESNDGWLALKTEEDWMLIPRQGQLAPQRGFDSVKLINTAALLFKEDERKLTFSNGTEIELDDHIIRSFPGQPDFLLIKKGGALGLYDKDGKKVFDGEYDDLQFVNDSLLRVTVNDKQGIIHKRGTFVLNPIFETLDVQEDLILTLFKGSIGCYDLSNNVLIPPEFESRVEKRESNYLVKKNGKYGIINRHTDEVIGFDFEEINIWNDTSYLVRKEGVLSIINQQEEILVENFDGLDLLFERDTSSIFRFVQEGKFGLITNDRGVILEPEYSDILNIGDQNDPLFFADQHLSNAGFHVVSYVNVDGELLLAKAYSKEEFDRIICDD